MRDVSRGNVACQIIQHAWMALIYRDFSYQTGAVVNKFVASENHLF